MMIISLRLSILSVFLTTGNHYALQRTLFFLPFFVAGFCVSDRREQIVKIVKRIPIVFSIFIVLTLLCINTYIGYNQLPFNTGNVPYFNWEMELSYAHIWRVIFTILCVIISIAFLRLVPNKQTYVSGYGSKTIVLYVYHAIILFYIKLFSNIFELPGNTYIAHAEFLVVVPILMLISKSKHANSLISSLTQIIKRKINV